MGHFIEECEGCGTVIAQCRCPSPDKERRRGVCPACKAGGLRPPRNPPPPARPSVFYVAHPVAGPDRARNLERVRRWWRWLIRQYPDASVQIPWMVYVEELDESPENHRRGIRDDLEVLLRCDAIVLVGGNLSPGMQAELEVAKQAGLTVIDLLELGPEPPEGP